MLSKDELIQRLLEGGDWFEDLEEVKSVERSGDVPQAGLDQCLEESVDEVETEDMALAAKVEAIVSALMESAILAGVETTELNWYKVLETEAMGGKKIALPRMVAIPAKDFLRWWKANKEQIIKERTEEEKPQ